MSDIKRVEARKLKGFRDFLPCAAQARQQILACIHHQSQLAGYSLIDTPSMEYADVLLGPAGNETEKEVYRFTDHGERDVGLRFDLTVPFARYVSENFSELTFPFKKLQIGEVWRGEKPQKGRYRQFCQADFDIIGVDSEAADIDVLATMIHTLHLLIGRSFTVSVNSRTMLSHCIKKILGDLSAAQEQKVLIALDKLAKIGADKVAKLLTEAGASEESARELLGALSKPDATKPAEAFGDSARFFSTLKTIQALCEDTDATIKWDPTIARGLGYYTGIVFETTIDDLPKFGSVSSGGRYNDLVGRFGKHQLAGVGGSIGVDRLLAALEELKIAPTFRSSEAFVAIASTDAQSEAFKLTQQLRTAGVSTDIAVKLGKLSNQFKVADKRNCSYVIVIGGDEVKSQVATIKTLASGEEAKIPFGDLSAYIIERRS